jgi:hypothetical protein
MLPEELVGWYAQHGYQFLGLSEHNTLASNETWVSAAAVRERAGDDVKARMDQQFGAAHWVTRTRDGVEEWRLRTLRELRLQFEAAGRFLLLSNEEVTNEAANMPIHLTAVNISEPVAPVNDVTAASAIEETLRRVERVSRRQGYPALGVVNHPNFAWAIGADLLAQTKAAQFVEIFNGHPYTASRGDIGKRSVVRLWDMANAERVLERGWPPLFGIAGDDSHARFGADEATPGRGWIVVRAPRLAATDLIVAMKKGDFYASTGVTLARCDYNAQNRELSVAIAPEAGVTYLTEFVATKAAAQPLASTPATDRWDSPLVGVVVGRESATEARYRLANDDVFVRATVTASRRPNNPIVSDYAGDDSQFEQAFTQPVGWQNYLASKGSGLRGCKH